MFADFFFAGVASFPGRDSFLHAARRFRRERHARRHRRLQVEALEDRRLLAITAMNDDYSVAAGQTLVVDGTAGTWQMLASMPTARSALAAAALDGLLYTAGGTLNGGVNASTVVEAYDPLTNTWTSKPSLPTQTTDAAAAVLNGEWYVIGGWPGSVPTNQVQIYTPATDSWRYGTAMPALSACSVATELDGRLYVLTACDGYRGFRKRLDMYDPATDTWTSKASAPQEHAGAGTAVIDGKWYVAGGGIWGSPTNRLDVYDPLTDTWTTRAALPTARTDMVGAAIGGKLYVAGGSGADGVPLASVDIYDPVTDTWSSGPAIPTPRSQLDGAAIGGSLIAVGGIPAGTPATRVGTNQSLGPAASVLANDTHSAGSLLTATLVTQPAHGDLSFNPDGTFTYTPDADFSGNDSFTYRAWSGAESSNVATVNIMVTAGAPAAEIARLGFAFRLGAGYDDSGAAVAVDAAGNVYVVGLFEGKVDFDPSGATVNLSGDAFIAKYTSSGALVWARSLTGDFGYEGADICVDADNVYVTGGFEGRVDFDPGPGVTTLDSGSAPAAFVLKLNSSGNFVWARAFRGGETGGLGIAVDPSGNVYTTGFFSGTVDFDPGDGVYNLTSPPISGNPSFDAYVSKLDGSGNFVWAKRVGSDSPTQDWYDMGDQGYDIAVDSEGNVYTTGTFRGHNVDFDPDPNRQFLLSSSGTWDGSAYYNDAFVWKLNTDGDFAWAKRLGGPAQGRSIAVDAQRNVYTSGIYFGEGAHFHAADGVHPIQATGGRTIYVSKLDPTGGFLWASGFASIPVETYTHPQVSLGLDSTGRVCVAGQFRGWGVDFDPSVETKYLSSEGGTDVFLARLDAQNGGLVSADSLGGTSDDLALGLATGPAGSVYVTGSFRGTVTFEPDDVPPSLKSAGGQDVFVAKIEYRTIVAEPEIEVSSGGTGIADGGTLNFGSTRLGVAAKKSVTVKNAGTQALNLTELGPLPAGFTIAPAFSPVSLAPNASVSYTVTLQSNTPGNYQGTLTIGNNDSDENPFHIVLHGQVMAAATETYFDSDGDSYTVKLSGPGTVLVQRATDADGRGPIGTILLTGTTAKSSLSVTVKKAATGDGKVTIGQIVGDGDLKSLSAAKSDLIGAGLDINGWVGQITLGDLKNEMGIWTDIRLGGTATQSTKITLGEVWDSRRIEVGAKLASLTAQRVLGSPSLSAPAIDKLSTAAGPLQIDLLVNGAVKSISTKGGGASGDWQAASFGTIAVSGGGFDGSVQAGATRATLGKTAALGKLTVSGGDFTGHLHALGNVGTVQISKDKAGRGGSMLDAHSAAASFGTVNIGKDLTNSVILAGANLGADLELEGTGAAADSFGPGSIAKFSVGGQVQETMVGAGLDPMGLVFRNGNDEIAGGTTSKVGAFSIGGAAGDGNYFRAGAWPKSVKIGGVSVSPWSDPRFLDLQNFADAGVTDDDGQVTLQLPLGQATFEMLDQQSGHPIAGLLVGVSTGTGTEGLGVLQAFDPANQYSPMLVMLHGPEEPPSESLAEPLNAGDVLAASEKYQLFVPEETDSFALMDAIMMETQMPSLADELGDAARQIGMGLLEAIRYLPRRIDQVSGGRLSHAIGSYVDQPIEALSGPAGTQQIVDQTDLAHVLFAGLGTPTSEHPDVAALASAVMVAKRDEVLPWINDGAQILADADQMLRTTVGNVAYFLGLYSPPPPLLGFAQISAIPEPVGPSPLPRGDFEVFSRTRIGDGQRADVQPEGPTELLTPPGEIIRQWQIEGQGISESKMTANPGDNEYGPPAPVASEVASLEIIAIPGLTGLLDPGTEIVIHVEGRDANGQVVELSSPAELKLWGPPGLNIAQLLPTGDNSWKLTIGPDAGAVRLIAKYDTIRSKPRLVSSLGPAFNLPIIVIEDAAVVEGKPGTTATCRFNVYLNKPAPKPVTVDFNTAWLGSASPVTDYRDVSGTLTFKTGQTRPTKNLDVTVLGDAIAEGNETFAVGLSNPVNARLDLKNSAIGTILDDDVPGIIVSPTAGLVTTESGGKASFSVKLSSQPKADVTIALASSDPTEGTVSPTQLVFTDKTWSSAKTVTVTGVDDAQIDGDIPYQIVLTNVTSDDADYANPALFKPTVSVTNRDNDTLGKGKVYVTVVGNGYVTDSTGQIDTRFEKNLATYPPDAFPYLIAKNPAGGFPSNVVWDPPVCWEGVDSCPLINSDYANGLAVTAYITPQLAAGFPASGTETQRLADYAKLSDLINSAVDAWTDVRISSMQVGRLDAFDWQVTDLPGRMLGAVDGRTLLLDRDAAGFGWYVDLTPWQHEEFERTSPTTFRALPTGPAAGLMDLLTVITHELGHLLGFDDLTAEGDLDDIMAATLAPGIRRVPWAKAVDTALTYEA
jgi:N-acetylneuraminic acid mutarotase